MPRVLWRILTACLWVIIPLMHIVYIVPPRACLRGEFSRLSMHTTRCLLLMTHLPAQHCHLRFRVGFLERRGRRCFNGGSMCIVKRAHAFHYSLYPLIKIMSFLWVSVILICCRFRISLYPTTPTASPMPTCTPSPTPGKKCRKITHDNRAAAKCGKPWRKTG